MAMQPIDMVTFKGSLKSDDAYWYDYENKVALFFPRAGDNVQFVHTFACWIDGEVVAMNSCGGCVIEYGIDTYATIYKEESIRPMDWDKNSNTLSIDDLAERIVLSLKTVMNCNMDINTAKNIAGKILVAGYRKCDKEKP